MTSGVCFGRENGFVQTKLIDEQRDFGPFGAVPRQTGEREHEVQDHEFLHDCRGLNAAAMTVVLLADRGVDRPRCDVIDTPLPAGVTAINEMREELDGGVPVYTVREFQPLATNKQAAMFGDEGDELCLAGRVAEDFEGG